MDAVLERRLWEEWYASFDAGDYEACLERAEERHDALFESEEFHGTYRGAYGPESPWTQTWEQATEMATRIPPRTCTVLIQHSGVHHR